MKKWEELLFKVCVCFIAGMLVIGCCNIMYDDFVLWHTYIIWAMLLVPIDILTRCIRKFLTRNI